MFEHGRTLDKFIGDGLMVFFGDPEEQPDHALRAVNCAVAMQRRVRELSAAALWRGRDPVEIRIGISTGVAVGGNMGSTRRLAYTALGSDVNLAQRLEGRAPAGGILVSSRTRELVQDRYPQLEPRQVTVKGLGAELTAFEVAPEAIDSGVPDAAVGGAYTWALAPAAASPSTTRA